MTLSVSIIIPYFNRWSLTHQLLYDLFSIEGKLIDEVVLVDDASDDVAVVGGEKWWKDNGLLPVRVVRFEENQGFLLSANKGLHKATGDVKVLISNDVRVRQKFIEQLVNLLSADPEQLVGNVFYPLSTGWNYFEGRVYPYLSGHFLAATGDVWEKLGYFDERYVPNDFEDVCLSTTALSLNVKLTSLSIPGITHLGGQTIAYTKEREELTKRNREKFQAKWLGDKG